MSDEVSLPNVRNSTCQNAPEYCARCKKCFTEHELHFEKAEPIGKAILGTDLIVLVHPVYVVPSPGYVKSLMGHLGGKLACSHRPGPAMFHKTAVIIT